MKTPALMHPKRHFKAMLVLTSVLVLGLTMIIHAAETWREDFDDVCGQVMGAESMTEKELSAMVRKADKLLPLIQASEDPGKKVFLTRLKKCRAVYQFMIEAKQPPAK